MATRMQQRKGTASQWTSANPILNSGEIGYESDTNKFKIGDGTNTWSTLPYFLDEDSIGTSLDGYIAESLLGAANGVAQLNSSGKLVSDQIPNVDEITQDAINTALTAGTGITKTYDDNANTITVAVDTTAIQAKVANVTDTEIGYLDGVTSSIQTQLNNSVLSSAIGYSVASLDNNRKLPLAELTANVAFMSDVSAQGASTLSTASSYADTAVATHNSDSTSVHGITDTSTLLTDSNTKTVTNKSVSLATNTVTGTIAQFNTAVSDADLATLAGVETLTNKTLTSPVVNTPTGITKSDVGLENVDNTTDAGKPVSTATQTALDLKAPLASPALTGTPTAPTAAAGTNSTQVATTAYADAAVAALVDAAPGTLNTLNEIAAAINDDASYAATITTALGLKAPLADPTFTGTVVLPSTTSIGDVSATEIGYLDNVTSSIQTQLNSKENSTYTFVTEAGTSRTLVASTDKTNTINFTSSSAITLTVPNDSADGANWAVGTFTDVFQYGTGQITVAGAAGVTIRSTDSQLKSRVRYSTMTLIKLAANEWLLVGDTAA